MKKILFLTYFWPPSGKASLQFPLRMIQYLPQYGFDPMVLTVEEETFTQKDESLLKEVPEGLRVFKSPVFEPFDLYRKFTGKGKDEVLVASETISKENSDPRHKIAVWIRMNLFVPDARIGWFPYAVKEGKRIFEESRFDAIISMGPPHSTHLIARRLSSELNVPFFPVLIDPWMDIAYYQGQSRSALTKKIDSAFEKKVFEAASEVFFVTATTLSEYRKKYPFLENKSDVLFWGYDGFKFENLPETKKEGGAKVLMHSGNIFDFQNPLKMWEFLKEKIQSGENFRLKFTGTVSPGIRKSITEAGLDPYTDYLGFLSYDDMIKEVMASDYLWVCAMEKRHLPGKLFEYLRTGKPVLAFGEDNLEVKTILEKSGAGMMFGFNESPEEFFLKAERFTTDMEFIAQFDRKEIAKKLASIIKTKI